MKTKEKNTGLSGATPQKEVKKHSKTWLAILAHRGNGRVIDMKAVLK